MKTCERDLALELIKYFRTRAGNALLPPQCSVLDNLTDTSVEQPTLRSQACLSGYHESAISGAEAPPGLAEYKTGHQFPGQRWSVRLGSAASSRHFVQKFARR
jgi:hypothetical protein